MRAAVLNTETLERMSAVVPLVLPGRTAPTLECGAGVVTRRAMDAADAAGLVFACAIRRPPTRRVSADVAVNAGGKKAVL